VPEREAHNIAFSKLEPSFAEFFGEIPVAMGHRIPYQK
jgi:hypothetical protein